MNKRRQSNQDYETVTRSRKERVAKSTITDNVFNSPAINPSQRSVAAAVEPVNNFATILDERTFLKRGHTLSFATLFLFTLVLYARPAEFYPSAATKSLALIIGVVTLAVFAATQLSLDGKLTARPPEVNYALFFMLAGALSIPFAIDASTAWGEFTGTFVRGILIFSSLLT